MSAITVKDETTIVRTVPLPHIRIWSTSTCSCFARKANRTSRDSDAMPALKFSACPAADALTCADLGRIVAR
jgi:hypothetical protein